MGATSAVPARIAQRAAKLRTDLDAHNYRYYVEDTPAVSDAEYDSLFRELEAIERDYSHPCIIVWVAFFVFCNVFYQVAKKRLNAF